MSFLASPLDTAMAASRKSIVTLQDKTLLQPENTSYLSPWQVVASSKDPLIKRNVGTLLSPASFSSVQCNQKNWVNTEQAQDLRRSAPGSAATISSLIFSARQTMSSSAFTIRVGRATFSDIINQSIFTELRKSEVSHNSSNSQLI